MILFYASRTQFIDHLLPVYDELKADDAQFCVHPNIVDYAEHRIANYTVAQYQAGLCYPPKDGDALVVCATSDAMYGKKISPKRPLILMEHGVGITFPHNQAYAGGAGIRRKVSLFLAPNEWIRDKTARVYPSAKQIVIGTPKMDKWRDRYGPASTQPIATIAFHWNGSGVAPEAGNALDHYQKGFPNLQKNLAKANIKLAGHGHPRILDELRPIYDNVGIVLIETFDQVLTLSSVYINDCSSTAYEAALMMPVILMNAPWFSRTVDYGIRFWRWTDIGPQVENIQQLPELIEEAVENPSSYYEQRATMQRQLYPYWGQSSARAAQAIRDFVRNK